MQSMMKRRSTWVLAVALGFGAVAPWASAKSDQVEMNKVPHAARQQIEKVAKGGTKVAVYDLGDEGSTQPVFMAHYTNAAGKRMEIKVTEDGKVLSEGETQSQRRKDAQARLEGAKTAEEKAKIEQELAVQRDAEDRARFDAWKAAQAQQAAAHVGAAAPGVPAVPAVPATPGTPANPAAPAAAHSHAGMTLKELSEEYNSTDRHAVPASSLPPGVKKTFDSETLGTKNIDYYQYTVDGQPFYSAHYDLGADARDVARVDGTGKLLGKNELHGSISAADESGHGATPHKNK